MVIVVGSDFGFSRRAVVLLVVFVALGVIVVVVL